MILARVLRATEMLGMLALGNEVLRKTLTGIAMNLMEAQRGKVK